MNAQEFEQAVRELRSRQRRFFHCKKDDPDRPKALEQVKEQEKVLLAVIEPVMALRPAHKTIESDRERFFLSVEFMLRKQREWIMSGGGSWSMSSCDSGPRSARKRNAGRPRLTKQNYSVSHGHQAYS